MHKWELRLGFFDAHAAVKHFPLLCIFFLLRCLLFLVMLCSDRQLFKLLSVYVHVGADHLVSDRGHRLVPVLLLGSIEKARNNYGVSLCHIVLNHLLDRF